MSRLLRVVLAIAFVAVGAAVPVLTPTAAGASTANGTAFTSWPWGNVTSGSGTAPVGGVCAYRWWSVDDSAGTIQQSFAWDNTHDGQLNASCDFITPPGQHVDSPPVSGGWCIDMNGMVPNVRMCVTGTFATNSTPYSDVGTLTTIVHNYHGTTSDWVHFSGQSTFIAGCQSGGSASNSVCGFHGAAGPYPANPLASSDCQPDNAATSLNQSSARAWFGASASTPFFLAIKCYVEAGTNDPGYPPTPDGSPRPTNAGTCSFGVITYILNNYSGLSDMTTNATGAFQLRNGDSVTFKATMTYSGSLPANVYLKVVNTDLSFQDQVPIPSIGPSGTADNVQVTWTNPGRSEYLYRAGIVAYMTGSGDCERDWNSVGGSQYNGPAGGGGIDQCILDTCGPSSDPTGASAFGDCFSGLFYNVEFFGLASFPWVHITAFPGDAFCGIRVLVIGTPTLWQSFANTISTDYSSSPLSQLATVVLLPLHASQAFADAATGGDCHGPTLTYPMVGAGMTTVNQSIQPLDACSGGVGTAASILRLATSVALWIGAFWLCFKLIAATLGFTPAIVTADGPVGVGHSFPESSGNRPDQGGSFL